MVSSHKQHKEKQWEKNDDDDEDDDDEIVHGHCKKTDKQFS